MRQNDIDPNAASDYGIGDSAPRPEDLRLVAGAGRYSDDIHLPGQAWGVMLRSPVAHATIETLDITGAAEMPGVLAVYTAEALDAAGYKGLACKLPLKNVDGSPLKAPVRPPLARDRVRYVGEGVAFVVAETQAQARDAAEAIEVEYNPLPAVADPTAAETDGAPHVHDEVPGNLALDWAQGDEAAIEEAFAKAAHVTGIRLVNTRVVAAPLEPRSAVATHDRDTGRYEIHVGCQGAFGLSRGLADIMNVEPGAVRVIAQDVGGSFGMKAPPYPEYIPLLHAAKTLDRPVHWRDDRTESFLSDQHGRSSHVEAELAMDDVGHFLAIRVRTIGDLGAWPSAMGPHIQSVNILKNVPGPYRTPLLRVEAHCVFTNTTPVGPFRGAGRPEGVYIRERLIEEAARETGRDPTELRRINLIPADQVPFEAPSGLVYDSGDFEGLLDQALEAADWQGFETRQKASADKGLLRGRGLSVYLEVTAPPGKEMGGLRFGLDGRVTVVTGTLDYGQGHHAAFAQVLHDKLGIPWHQVDLLQGDSDELLVGGGTGGSRTIMSTGKAVLDAADQVIDKGRKIAGHLLEASADDIEFAAGQFTIAGTDRSVSLLEIAAKVAAGDLPSDLPQSLDSELVSETPPSAFPNGCHVCEVEIDPATGTVAVDRCTVVDDFGTIVNPMLVEGQVHGGIVQGIGQATMELAVFDEEGQPLAGSFMDYALPRADDAPNFQVGFHPVPSTTNPLGVKGCGEAGVTGALPALMNAVSDVLARAGAQPIDMPATPERVWRALSEAKAA